MKNTFKAIGIVVAVVGAVFAFVIIIVGAAYLVAHGHGRLVGVTATITGVASAVGLVKVDLDARDRARKQHLVIR